MHTILVATVKPFAKKAVVGIQEIADEAGFKIKLLEKYADQKALHEAVKGVDALIVRSDIVDEEVFGHADKLKIVVRAGAGYDNIDLKAATAKNVVVMNTPGQNANAVAELTFGTMIYLNRNFYTGTSGSELRGKTIGLHAYGHVGRLIGLIGKGMGMDVLANDPYVEKIIIENDGVKYVPEVRDLYKKCQYVVISLPANDETKEYINYDLTSQNPNTLQPNISTVKDQRFQHFSILIEHSWELVVFCSLFLQYTRKSVNWITLGLYETTRRSIVPHPPI